jgi:hypothetical protein
VEFFSTKKFLDLRKKLELENFMEIFLISHFGKEFEGNCRMKFLVDFFSFDEFISLKTQEEKIPLASISRQTRLLTDSVSPAHNRNKDLLKNIFPQQELILPPEDNIPQEITTPMKKVHNKGDKSYSGSKRTTCSICKSRKTTTVCSACPEISVCNTIRQKSTCFLKHLEMVHPLSVEKYKQTKI